MRGDDFVVVAVCVIDYIVNYYYNRTYYCCISSFYDGYNIWEIQSSVCSMILTLTTTTLTLLNGTVLHNLR